MNDNCEKCAGTGEFVKPVGKRKCRACEGSGSFRHNRACRSCEGNGKDFVGRACACCHGRGRFYYGSTVSCIKCVGTGSSVRIKVYACRDCEGTGVRRQLVSLDDVFTKAGL